MALKSLHNNSDLLNILETLKDCELPDEVLKEKMLGVCKVHVPTKDTVVQCQLEEMELLCNFHSKYNTLSYKDIDTIVSLLRHYLLHDALAEKRIQNKQCAQDTLVDQMDELRRIEVQDPKKTWK